MSNVLTYLRFEQARIATFQGGRDSKNKMEVSQKPWQTKENNTIKHSTLPDLQNPKPFTLTHVTTILTFFPLTNTVKNIGEAS